MPPKGIDLSITGLPAGTHELIISGRPPLRLADAAGIRLRVDGNEFRAVGEPGEVVAG